jgi:predicted DNA-binding transcriptional regulator AlpA
MTNQPSRAEEDLITAGEIADVAGVSRPAVSNWRRRFKNFPKPVAVSPGGGDLFRFSDVEQWLREAGRIEGAIAPATTLWRAVDAARGRLSIERIIDMACAFIALLAIDRHVSLDEFVTAESQGTLERRVAERALQLRGEDPHVGDLLEPLLDWESSIDAASTERGAAEATLLSAFLALAMQSSDLATMFEEVLDRRERLRVYGGFESVSAADLADLMVRISSPSGTIFDPAAGEGGFLLRAAYEQRDAESSAPLRMIGQEINARTRRIAQVRLLVHGFSAEIWPGDSLSHDAVPDLRADVIYCDPPAGMRWQPTYLPDDPRWFAGLPNEANADLAWVQHVIHHLARTGRGYVTLPVGALFRRGRDAEVRRELIRRGAIEAIVSLPRGLVRGTSAATAVWSVRRPDLESQPTHVLLVNASEQKPADRGALDGAVEERIVEAVRRFRISPDSFEADPNFAVAVSVLDLLVRDATLVPAQWMRSTVSTDQLIFRIRGELRTIEDARAEVVASGPAPAFSVVSTESRSTIRIRELIESGAVESFKGVALKVASAPVGVPVLESPWSRRGKPIYQFVDLAKLKGKAKLTEPGDVVVVTVGDQPRAFVDEHGGHVLPDFMQALRIRGSGLDPIVLAGLLSAPSNRRFVEGATIPRIRLLDLELPRLTHEETRSLRTVLERLSRLESAATDVSRSASELRDNILDGVVGGQLEVRFDEPGEASDNASREGGPGQGMASAYE